MVPGFRLSVRSGARTIWPVKKWNQKDCWSYRPFRARKVESTYPMRNPTSSTMSRERSNRSAPLPRACAIGHCALHVDHLRVVLVLVILLHASAADQSRVYSHVGMAEGWVHLQTSSEDQHRRFEHGLELRRVRRQCIQSERGHCYSCREE
jgi:hypothetical protein